MYLVKTMAAVTVGIFILLHPFHGGGGGVSESMDGRGCAILALELVPKNLIFS